jgi:ABC-type bacteriocin/lantibiotic exporter with double-glycine peptidase domain
MKYSLKHVYIILLVVLASLLVFIVQGFYQQETKSIKQVEFKRTDRYIEDIGNITEVQAKINNPDTFKHNYTFKASINSVLFTEDIIKVSPNLPYTFQIMIPLNTQIIEGSIEEAVYNISIAVSRDDQSGPIDKIVYIYD